MMLLTVSSPSQAGTAGMVDAARRRCLHLLPEYREMQRELEVLRVERDHLARQVERWRGEFPI